MPSDVLPFVAASNIQRQSVDDGLPRGMKTYFTCYLSSFACVVDHFCTARWYCSQLIEQGRRLQVTYRLMFLPFELGNSC